MSDTLQNILACGQEEFLKKGFMGASLRSIAKAAGVTTGAIYGYFPDKKALFEALVGEQAHTLLEKYLSVQQQFAQLPPDRQAAEMTESSDAGFQWMIEYIYLHFDAFKLLLCCSAGTEYDSYVNRMVDVETQATLDFINVLKSIELPVNPVDEQLIHILSNAFFSGIFEIVVHDMSKEKADAYLKSLKEFYTAGWMRLLGL